MRISDWSSVVCSSDLDLQRGHPPTIRLEGSRTQALETGRTRLLVAAMSFTLAFALIGWRLVALGLMAEQHEPSLARTLSSDALDAGRADIVDPNGVGLPTPMPQLGRAAGWGRGGSDG